MNGAEEAQKIFCFPRQHNDIEKARDAFYISSRRAK
jgi:hypothetical protein